MEKRTVLYVLAVILLFYAVQTILKPVGTQVLEHLKEQSFSKVADITT